MARALAALTVVWLVALGAAISPRVRASVPLVPAVVYAAASRVCHQNPDRSFHTAGRQWPVCARCAGLYLTAPVGAFLALRRRAALSRRAAIAALTTFGTPTAISFAAEHLAGLPMTNAARFAAALPLGAIIAWIIIITAGTPASHRVH